MVARGGGVSLFLSLPDENWRETNGRWIARGIEIASHEIGSVALHRGGDVSRRLAVELKTPREWLDFYPSTSTSDIAKFDQFADHFGFRMRSSISNEETWLGERLDVSAQTWHNRIEYDAGARLARVEMHSGGTSITRVFETSFHDRDGSVVRMSDSSAGTVVHFDPTFPQLTFDFLNSGRLSALSTVIP